MKAPWSCTVEEVCPGYFRATFSVGMQHFVLTDSDDPEEAKRHCEFLRDQFVVALRNAGFIP